MEGAVQGNHGRWVGLAGWWYNICRQGACECTTGLKLACLSCGARSRGCTETSPPPSSSFIVVLVLCRCFGVSGEATGAQCAVGSQVLMVRIGVSI
eukprot:1160985-Pelagomonas_calceolata.AAC.4